MFNSLGATLDDPEDALRAPEELAAQIAMHLRAALEEIEAYSEELAAEATEEAL